MGDIATLPPSALSAAGKDIKSILSGHGYATDEKSQYADKVPALNSPECGKDRCCVWKHVADELFSEMWDAAAGMCTDLARGAIRLGFHDAGAWDKDQTFGGADGSILLSDEITLPENKAMTPTGNRLKAMYEKYKGSGITMADLIQTAAKVAAVSCPGGPRIRMFVGRVDNSAQNTRGLLPPPTMNASDIIDLFAKKSITPAGIVALIGAHTASRGHISRDSEEVKPQDTTPGIWDTKYFIEVSSSSPPADILRFNSDISLAGDPVTGPWFKKFGNNKGAWDKVSRLELSLPYNSTQSANTLPL
jgi:catalase (peroxidase I)